MTTRDGVTIEELVDAVQMVGFGAEAEQSTASAAATGNWPRQVLLSVGGMSCMRNCGRKVRARYLCWLHFCVRKVLAVLFCCLFLCE